VWWHMTGINPDLRQMDPRRPDSRQKEILDFQGTSLMVFGAAGSGKTASLVARVEGLLADGARPDEILILAAAGSIREKLRSELSGKPGIRIETPAGLALKMMTSLGRNWRLLERFEEFLFLRRVMRGLISGAPSWSGQTGVGTVQAVLGALDDLRRGDSVAGQETYLARLDQFLNDYYNRRALAPYTGVVRAALAAGFPKKDPQVRELLVDGWESMSPLERRFVAAMRPFYRTIIFSGADGAAAAGDKTVAAAGDGTGSGAVAEANMVLHLTEDHRRLPHYTERFLLFRTAAEEAAGTAAEIAALLCGGMAPEQIMVLYRDYASIGFELETAFTSAGIPYRVLGGQPLVQGAAARLLAQYFESLKNPGDEEHLMRWLSSPLLGLDRLALVRAVRMAREKGMTLQELRADPTYEISGQQAISALLDGFDKDAVAAAAHDSRLYEIACAFLKRSGVVARLTGTGAGASGSTSTLLTERVDADEQPLCDKDDEMRRLAQYLQLLKDFDGAYRQDGSTYRHGGVHHQEQENDTTPAVDVFLDASAAFWGENVGVYADTPAVKILGAHQAKGHEAEAVFVCGMIMGNFPRGTENDPLKEFLGLRDTKDRQSRRAREFDLFQCAVTRARQILTVSCSQKYNRNEKEPSLLALERFGSPEPYVREWARAVGTTGVTGADADTAATGGATGATAGATTVAVAAAAPMEQEAIPARRAFSHSGIREYLSCPKKYFYGHILRLKGVTLPGASLGTLVHQTLSVFHKENPNLDALPPGSAGVRLRAILEQEIQALQSELGPQLLSASLQRLAAKLLDDYLAVLALPGWEGRTVLETEKPFSFRYGNYIIRGRIDRIDQLQDGTFELVDYKTSAYDSAAAKATKKQFLNIDNKADYQPTDFQLPIYYLALESEGKKVTRLSYYQIGSQKLRVFKVNPENPDRSGESAFEITGGDLEIVRQQLSDTLSAMAAGQYPARPKTPLECRYCCYKWICTTEENEASEIEAEAGEEA